LASNGGMTNTRDWDSPPDLPSSSEDRNWAMAAHLAPALATLLSGGSLGVVVTLVIYLIKKDENAFIGDAAREALNFQITVFLAFLACMVMFFSGFLTCIGLPGFFVVGLAALVLGVVAAIRVNKGEVYRYPVCLRLIN